jgi:hypothetical protein
MTTVLAHSLERDARLSGLSVSLKRLVHSQATTPSRKQPLRSPR